MEEFAALSGLSRPTVSKYFNDPASVRPKTRERIEAALERYDFRPNIFAVNQNRSLTKNVGIVVPVSRRPVLRRGSRASSELRCIEAGFRRSSTARTGERKLEKEILEGLTAPSSRPGGCSWRRSGGCRTAPPSSGFCRDVPTVLF